MKYYRINNIAEMQWLANKMKMDAVQEKQDAPDDYSKTEEEAFERTKKMFTTGNVPHSAAILYKENVYSIVLTCEAYDKEELWHLSVGKANPMGGPPERMDDETCKFVTEAFFQGTVEECPPEGVFKNVRHFRVGLSNQDE